MSAPIYVFDFFPDFAFWFLTFIRKGRNLSGMMVIRQEIRNIRDDVLSVKLIPVFDGSFSF
uniref:Uncharacterized protein n=1 Tax=Octopus bimaculoides TaxID=37653 RepID=A0A0L8FW46_OCTBM